MAPVTIGTRPAAVGQPTPRSSSQRTTPVAASSPNALPPERTTALTLSTRLSGLSRWVSRVPCAPARGETPPTASPATTTAVQPVGRSVSVKCPTRIPGTAVMVAFAAGRVCAEAGLKAVVRTFRSAVALVGRTSRSAVSTAGKPSRIAQSQTRISRDLSGIVVFMSKISPWLALCFVLSACSSPESTPATDTVPGPTPTVQRTPIGDLPDIDAEAVLAHTKVLSSDEFAGRAPGTKGEEATVNYLVEQFKKAGLKPGNADGSYLQKVPLVGITADGAPLVIRSASGAERQLKWADDVVAWTKHVADGAAIENSEMVFVGYGVVAPEFEW